MRLLWHSVLFLLAPGLCKGVSTLTIWLCDFIIESVAAQCDPQRLWTFDGPVEFVLWLLSSLGSLCLVLESGSTASITSKPNEEPSPNSGQNPSSKDTKTGKSENRKSRQCRNVSYGRSEATLRSLDEVEKSEETHNSLGRPGPLVGSQRSTPARPAHHILSLNFLNHPNLSEQLDEVFKGVFGTSQKASHVSTSPLVLFTSAPKPPTNSVICDPSSTSPGALAAFASERRRYFNWDRFSSDTIMFSDASQMMDKPPTGTNPEGFRDKLHPAKIEDFELRTPIKDTMKDK